MMMMMMIIIIIIIIIIICKALGTETTDNWHTHTCPNKCVKREMS